VITIRSPLKKTLLLLTLTTLTISLGTSLSGNDWNMPMQDGEYNGNIEFNVTNSDDASSINFSLDGPTSIQDKNNTGVENQDYVTGTFNVGDATEDGDYTVTAESSAGDNIDRSFVLDREGPSITFVNDISYVAEDPTITVDVEDSLTGVNSVDATISGSASVEEVEDDVCDGSSSCEVDISVNTDMDQGDTFDIDVTADDGAGNSNTKEENGITLDSEWDGDSDASVEWSESDDTLLSGFGDEDQDVDISFQPDTVSDTSLTCEVDGDEVDDANVDASDEEETASCEIDSDDYSSSVFDLTVEAEDEAGNTQTLVDGEELIWDTSAPTIDSLEQLKGVSTFNTGFDWT